MVVRPVETKVVGETESVFKDRESKMLDSHESVDLSETRV